MKVSSWKLGWALFFLAIGTIGLLDSRHAPTWSHGGFSFLLGAWCVILGGALLGEWIVSLTKGVIDGR